MKYILITIVFSIAYLCSAAQVVTTKGNKVEVRDIYGKYIASGNYTNINDAVAGDNIIVLWYQNDKIEVRTENLKYIASATYSALTKVVTSEDYIILYYKNNKIETRDRKLKYISSWYQ